MVPKDEQPLREAVRRTPTPQQAVQEKAEEDSGWKAELMEQECIFGLKRKIEAAKAEIEAAKAKKRASNISKPRGEDAKALHCPEASGGKPTPPSEEEVRKARIEMVKARMHTIRSALKLLVENLALQT